MSEVNSEANIETQEDANNELFFDPEDVTNRTGEYSALSDLYGLSVFSDEFEAKEAMYKEQDKEKKNNLFQGILDSEDLENQYDKIFTNVMAAEDTQILKNENTSKSTSNNISATELVLIILVVFCFCGFLLFNIKRIINKGNKKYENNFDDYNIKDGSNI